MSSKIRRNLALLAALAALFPNVKGASASEPAPAQALAQAVNPPTAADYAAALKEANDALNDLQKLIENGRYNEAFVSAATIVRNVESRAGIRSKTPEPIDCGDILDPSDLTKSYEDLSPRKKIELAELINKRDDGQFLNLVNAAKRANALYLRAQYLQMSTRDGGGKLLDSDLKFFDDNFKKIQAVKIYFTSKKLGNDL